MKKFLFGVFIWFLFQLVMISLATNGNAIKDMNAKAHGTTQAEIDARHADDCTVGSSDAFIASVIFPLTSTTLVKGDWCWNN